MWCIIAFKKRLSTSLVCLSIYKFESFTWKKPGRGNGYICVDNRDKCMAWRQFYT